MPREKTFDYEQILEEAMGLFWKKGYHATSMDDLVQSLGLNRSSLYNSFGGKKELFLKGIKHYQDKNLFRLRQILESESSPKEGLKKLFEFALKNLCTDKEKKGCLLVNSSTELIPSEEDVKEFLKENKKKVEELILEFIQKGIRLKVITNTKNPKELAEFLFTLYNGIGVVSKLDISTNQHQFTIKKVMEILGD